MATLEALAHAQITSENVSAQSAVLELCIGKARQVLVSGGGGIVVGTSLEPLCEGAAQ
jgi:hypothetical protein